MGEFSWLKADELTKVANVVYGWPFKCLIPLEFGGGFIKDHYQGYGYLGRNTDGSPMYDMYELLAFWNADQEVPVDYQPIGYGNGEQANLEQGSTKTVRSMLRFDGAKFPALKEIDGYTDYNRIIGIDIGCTKEQVDKLRYPLKLVSASYTGTYEECPGCSYWDPNQGCGQLFRKKLR